MQSNSDFSEMEGNFCCLNVETGRWPRREAALLPSPLRLWFLLSCDSAIPWGTGLVSPDALSSHPPHLHFSELEGGKEKGENRGKLLHDWKFHIQPLLIFCWLELCHIVIPSCKKGLEVESSAV